MTLSICFSLYSVFSPSLSLSYLYKHDRYPLSTPSLQLPCSHNLWKQQALCEYRTQIPTARNAIGPACVMKTSSVQSAAPEGGIYITAWPLRPFSEIVSLLSPGAAPLVLSGSVCSFISVSQVQD